jgi:hypothetical protein
MFKSAQTILLCLVSCLLASAGTTGTKTAERSHLGDTIPAFSLPATDGRHFSLNDSPEAKGCIVVFTCVVHFHFIFPHFLRLSSD